MSSALAASNSRSAWVLQKTRIPAAVAVELLRRNPDIIQPLADNSVLDSSVFDNVSWDSVTGKAAESLIWNVSDHVAVRWVSSSDRRKRTTAAFLQAWTMGSDMQREFLRTRATVLPQLSKQDVTEAFTKNLFDQDIVYEYLSGGTWWFPRHQVAVWLAHNPSVVDDTTFVDWLVNELPSPPETSRQWSKEIIAWAFEATLALTVRPHLVGALLDKAGPGAAVIAAEVDAPAHIDQILDMLETEWGSHTHLQPVECVRTLYRLACHPGLSEEVRTEICSRLSEQESVFRDSDPSSERSWYRARFRYTDDATASLTALPSGNPADYTLAQLRSAVGFYLELPGVRTESSGQDSLVNRRFHIVNAHRPTLIPVDVSEGLTVAAIRHQKADPSIGDALHKMGVYPPTGNKTWCSHRLLDLTRMLSESFPVGTPLDAMYCGTHRSGHILSPGSVARTTLGMVRKGELGVSAGWQDIGSYRIRDALHTWSKIVTTDSMLEHSAGNVSVYLEDRLGSTVDDVEKWEAFLQLVNSFEDSMLLSETVDMALLLRPDPAPAE